MKAAKCSLAFGVNSRSDKRLAEPEKPAAVASAAKALEAFEGRRLALDACKQYARELKLDVARFEKDLADIENEKRIDADKAEATAMG